MKMVHDKIKEMMSYNYCKNVHAFIILQQKCACIHDLSAKCACIHDLSAKCIIFRANVLCMYSWSFRTSSVHSSSEEDVIFILINKQSLSPLITLLHKIFIIHHQHFIIHRQHFIIYHQHFIIHHQLFIIIISINISITSYSIH